DPVVPAQPADPVRSLIADQDVGTLAPLQTFYVGSDRVRLTGRAARRSADGRNDRLRAIGVGNRVGAIAPDEYVHLVRQSVGVRVQGVIALAALEDVDRHVEAGDDVTG